MSKPKTLFSACTGQSPLLTWYDANEGRMELSGRVVGNWLIKLANLLTVEMGMLPGEVLRIDTPPHWKSCLLALAASSCGVLVDATAEEPDVVVSDTAQAADDFPAAREVLLLEAASLPLKYRGEVTWPCRDLLVEVRGMSDELEADLSPAFAEMILPGGIHLRSPLPEISSPRALAVHGPYSEEVLAAALANICGGGRLLVSPAPLTADVYAAEGITPLLGG
ncbi:TIGR03089 family protein [Dermabacteraceae bacterium P13095]